MEVVRQLEVEHRVVNFPCTYLLYVLLWPHLAGILVVVRYSSAEHYCLEVQFLTELFAVFVHSASKAQSAVVGVDEHLDAIEYVSVRVVGIERLVAGDLGVGVVAFHHVVIDYNAQRAADNLVVGDDYNSQNLCRNNKRGFIA